MRDKLIDDKKYYDRFIKVKENLIERSINKISNGSISIENIPKVWHRIFFKKFECVIAKYGRGDNLNDLKKDLDNIYENIELEWQDEEVKFKKGRPQKMVDKYRLNSYCYMVWLLSLSILLRINKERINQITKLIESAQIKDDLILYLLSKLNGKEYETRKEVTYPLFKKLMKNKVDEIDSKQISTYLKSWRKNAKLFTWHNYINSAPEKESYFGYWSFESAAMLALNDLNDESFNEHPNYPKDLVEYYKNKNKKIVVN